MNVTVLNGPIERHRVADWIKKRLTMLPTRDSFQGERHTQTENEEMEKIFHANRNNKKAGVAILMSG